MTLRNSLLSTVEDCVNSNLQHVDDILALQDTRIAQLQNSLDNRVVFSGLHLAPYVGTQDTKTPFQWVQAGNTGNTGGGSAKAHGTSKWEVLANGSRRITVNPANIDNRSSDDFLNYMVLPFPKTTPNQYGVKLGNFSAVSKQDWSNAQQVEFWIETIEGGFIYTINWAVNSTSGLRYAQRGGAGQGDTWVNFDPAGKPMLIDMSQPTSFTATATIDRAAHTIMYDNLLINGQSIPVNKQVTAPAYKGDKALRQLSVSVQLDGKPAGVPYAMVLDDMSAWYE